MHLTPIRSGRAIIPETSTLGKRTGLGGNIPSKEVLTNIASIAPRSPRKPDLQRRSVPSGPDRAKQPERNVFGGIKDDAIRCQEGSGISPFSHLG